GAVVRYQRAGGVEEPAVDVSGPADADGLAGLSNIVPRQAQLGGETHGFTPGRPDVAREADREGFTRERSGHPGANVADRLARAVTDLDGRTGTGSGCRAGKSDRRSCRTRRPLDASPGDRRSVDQCWRLLAQSEVARAISTE